MLKPVPSKIERSEERIKQTGEVFTPLPLVNELLDRLPQDVWNNPNKTFIDPACGDGNFLVEVVKRKIAHGSTPTQALSTTYGVELMPDNVAECRRRLLEIVGDTLEHRSIVQHHIACADALTFGYWEENLFDDGSTSATPQSRPPAPTTPNESTASLFDAS